MKAKLLSPVRLLATPWTTAYQDPPSVGFSSQEYWSGLPLPSPCNPLEVNKNKLLRKYSRVHLDPFFLTSEFSNPEPVVF